MIALLVQTAAVPFGFIPEMNECETLYCDVREHYCLHYRKDWHINELSLPDIVMSTTPYSYVSRRHRSHGSSIRCEKPKSKLLPVANNIYHAQSCQYERCERSVKSNSSSVANEVICLPEGRSCYRLCRSRHFTLHTPSCNCLETVISSPLDLRFPSSALAFPKQGQKYHILEKGKSKVSVENYRQMDVLRNIGADLRNAADRFQMTYAQVVHKNEDLSFTIKIPMQLTRSLSVSFLWLLFIRIVNRFR